MKVTKRYFSKIVSILPLPPPLHIYLFSTPTSSQPPPRVLKGSKLACLFFSHGNQTQVNSYTPIHPASDDPGGRKKKNEKKKCLETPSFFFFFFFFFFLEMDFKKKIFIYLFQEPAGGGRWVNQYIPLGHDGRGKGS